MKQKLLLLIVGEKAKILAGVIKQGYPVVELDVDGVSIDKKAF